ncbi:ImmA/IrrE family metallo-endopeptidase [Ferrimonas aestuarii]|uniref:ImmA/IrrE family metallo-endopeptidase n=2 Tax=Ferrimonas aestuarii TaxID=2569539 RepID=A0A4U1BKR6_9GAMM|nr:ImmA/IrrE family metallo-endopeptidase [Ferrimonas aestuarii]
MIFNPSRLKLARQRRQYTIKALSEKVGLTSRMVSEYEKERCSSIPPEKTVSAFAQALNYPESFFFEGELTDQIEQKSVSFRSAKSMKASNMHAAIGAGIIGELLNSYFESKFQLVQPKLPELVGEDPELAASMLRSELALGEKSISNMVHILESLGVRVYSLDENTQAVDAFSFWKNDIPFVFLNTKKSGERSRFDAAHELAHLILHKNDEVQGRDKEREADAFAAHFLMPKNTVLSRTNRFLTVSDVIKLKKNWKVSAMALIVHMKNVGAITEWHYKNLIIEASKLGLRTNEIDGIERERSKLISKMLLILKKHGVGISDIARNLSLPYDEVSSMLFDFEVVHRNENPTRSNKKPSLRLVK